MHQSIDRKKLFKYVPAGRKKIGLALGSGAARGLAHLGVLRVLSELEIPIDCVSGTSAGALVGAFYAAGKIEELHTYAKRLTKRRALRLIDLTFPRNGLIEGRKIEKFLKRYLAGVMIEDLAVPFACVATEYHTGAEVVLDRGGLVGAVRASLSIPGIFLPSRLGGMILVDGGVVNPVPVKVVRDLGAEFVIAVDICPRIPQACMVASQLGDEDLKEIVPRRRLPLTPLLRQEKLPSVFEVIMGSIDIMEAAINKVRIIKEKPDLVITPALDEVGTFDFYKYDLGVVGGEEAAWSALSNIEKVVRKRRGK
jgi:NTE family protein